MKPQLIKRFKERVHVRRRRFTPIKQCIFAIICRNTRKFRLFRLQRRNSQKIIPIILNHIPFGSKIVSDSASFYVNNLISQKLHIFVDGAMFIIS